MSDSIRSRVLNFLSEPRSLKEVAEYLGASTSVARRHIRGAIKQGQIWVCEYPRHSDLNHSDKHRLRETVFYISKNSYMLSKRLTGFSVVGVAKMQRIRSATTFVKFHSKTSKYRLYSRDNAANLERSELMKTSFPKTRKSRDKLMRGNHRHGRVTAKPLRQSQFHSLSAAERLSMLRALSLQPLSYLELHGGLNVSRQMVKTFTKNGLIKEMWGPRDIGVRFRLTGKGEQYLKRLDAASRLGKDKIRKATIQLKHRSL